ncbi:MT-A70 family methyltransferase [Brucella pituitosa]|uniref:MT-A70 family methyltransferase n=1 Tax=Brucella pituitosa TaxID=571256 RepID=UPI003F4AF660
MDAPVHIKIADIDVRDRLREVDASKVEALKQSFAELGMRTPITVRVGEDGLPFVLSAGAHRLEAARQMGWLEVPGFIRDESKLDSELWEIDENLARSELTAADRAVFTFRRKELYLLKYPETQHGGDRKSSRQLGDLIERQERRSFVAATAELTGKTERSIQRDAERGEKICEAALRLLRGTRLDNGVTLDRLKKLPNDLAQIAYIEGALADEKRIRGESKEIRTHQQKVKHAVRLTNMAMIADLGKATAPAKLDRIYSVYYADPAWKFRVHSEVTGGEKSADNHYPTMTTDDIVTEMVELIGGNNPAVLFLWATNPMLPDALRVMEACGFKYVHHWIWDKVDIGNGYWGRDQHELLLIGRRGDIACPLPEMLPPTVHREKKGKHSAKPAYFAEQIEKFYPDVAKLELNARGPRKGWDVWGHEANGRVVP